MMSKQLLTEQEYEVMEYALRYAQKVGVDAALEEVRRDSQALQTANQRDKEMERQNVQTALKSLFAHREEIRLYEGRAVRIMAELLMVQDKIATLQKSLAFLEPNSELSQDVVAELNHIHTRLEDLEQQSLVLTTHPQSAVQKVE